MTHLNKMMNMPEGCEESKVTESLLDEFMFNVSCYRIFTLVL